MLARWYQPHQLRGLKNGVVRWTTTIRLSKRMGELDLCSRREADRLIRDGKILVNGQLANIGEKVPSDLHREKIQFVDFQETENVVNAVVLNKPQGYVSGQAEHGHPPAIRLLSRDRLWETNIGGGDADISLPSSFKGFAPAGRLVCISSTGRLNILSSDYL